VSDNIPALGPLGAAQYVNTWRNASVSTPVNLLNGAEGTGGDDGWGLACTTSYRTVRSFALYARYKSVYIRRAKNVVSV